MAEARRDWLVTHARTLEEGRAPPVDVSTEQHFDHAQDWQAYWRPSVYHAGRALTKADPSTLLQRFAATPASSALRHDLFQLRTMWPYLVQYVTIRGYDMTRLEVAADGDRDLPADDMTMMGMEAGDTLQSHAGRTALLDAILERTCRGLEDFSADYPHGQKHSAAHPPASVHGLHYLGGVPAFDPARMVRARHPRRLGLAVCLNDIGSGAGFSFFDNVGPVKVLKNPDAQQGHVPKLDVAHARRFVNSLPESHALLVLGAGVTAYAFRELVTGYWQWEHERDNAEYERDKAAVATDDTVLTAEVEEMAEPVPMTPAAPAPCAIQVIDQSLLQFDWFGNLGNPLHYVQPDADLQAFLYQHQYSEHSRPRLIQKGMARRMHALCRGESLAIQQVAPTISPQVRIYTHGIDSLHPPKTVPPTHPPPEFATATTP